LRCARGGSKMKILLLISYLVGGIFLPIQWDEASLPVDQAMNQNKQVIEVINDPSSQQIYLTTVNDLSLYDSSADVMRKLGPPEQKATDSDLVEYTIYVYSDMSIYFRDELIDYVEISNEATTLWLDQTEVPATIEAIKAVMGEPDYNAEDGIVFQRKEAILKLFINPDNGELESIAYYHIAST